MNILYHWVSYYDIVSYLSDTTLDEGPLLSNIKYHSDIEFNKIICFLDPIEKIEWYFNKSRGWAENEKRKDLNDKSNDFFKNSFKNFITKYSGFLKEKTKAEIEIREYQEHEWVVRDIIENIKSIDNRNINFYLIHDAYGLKKKARSFKSPIAINIISKKARIEFNKPKKVISNTILSNIQDSAFNNLKIISRLPDYREVKFELYDKGPKRETFSEKYKKYSSYELGPKHFHNILTVDASLKELKEYANFLSVTEENILILGESGTGKELFAKAIHDTSKRIGKLMSFNCAALTSSLIESELFGKVKGSHTGATETTVGYLEQADKGTLFIDEIGDIPLDTQVKLLRALQEKEFYKVGDQKNLIKSDFRLICATNKNLSEEIKHGSFRDDLYYRISDFELIIPALRNRNPEDKILLFENELKKLQNIFPEMKNVKITQPVKTYIRNHNWPGNVREIIAFAKRIFFYSKFRGSNIDEFAMQYAKIKYSKENVQSEIYKDKEIKSIINKSYIVENTTKKGFNKYEDLFTIDFFAGFQLKDFLESIEKTYIIEAFKTAQHKKNLAARILGYNKPQNLDYPMRKYGIKISKS